MFLIQVKFSCRRDKKIFLSEFTFSFWEKSSNIFLIWVHISQIKKIFPEKFWGFCSVHYLEKQKPVYVQRIFSIFLSVRE